MKPKLISMLAIAIFPTIAFACPLGTVPLKGNGWEGCAPANEGNQDPGPKWRTQWGAIATDGSKDIVAASVDSRTKKMAEKLALAECRKKGGENCRIDLSYYDQCAAVIASPTAFYAQRAVSEDAAIQRGLDRCRQAEQDCEIRYSACSLPTQR